MLDNDTAKWPKLKTAGYDGFLVSFGDQLSEGANRAALAFRNAVDRANWPAVQETSTSLVSTYLRFDPLALDHNAMRKALAELAADRDWFSAELPQGRRFWRVPTAYAADFAPQLDEAAKAAGLTTPEAIASISTARVRVQTIGFAPGMPYLGELPDTWNIPRQKTLNAQTPAGGLCVAIRQLVLFPVATPTGWRHIGQTAFRLFRPESDQPFVLRPGDEVMFEQTTPETYTRMQADPDGGAVSEIIR
jgi:inhibitor of KinA